MLEIKEKQLPTQKKKNPTKKLTNQNPKNQTQTKHLKSKLSLKEFN